MWLKQCHPNQPFGNGWHPTGDDWGVCGLSKCQHVPTVSLQTRRVFVHRSAWNVELVREDQRQRSPRRVKLRHALGGRCLGIDLGVGGWKFKASHSEVPENMAVL